MKFEIPKYFTMFYRGFGTKALEHKLNKDKTLSFYFFFCLILMTYVSQHIVVIK